MSTKDEFTDAYVNAGQILDTSNMSNARTSAMT